MVDKDQTTAPTASAEPETPATFLKALVKSLEGSDGVDGGLATILATHILVAEPARDAIAKAKAAIVTLAQARASPTKEGLSDG
jgi:hypothetical protein